ncbi:hypothetical protein P9112_012380 [Eukaryota sp. TZLM1-RC]
MTWTPNADGIASLTTLLQRSSTPDEQVQRDLHQQLQHFTQTVPDFTCYLSHLLAHSTDLDISVRQTAGLVLRGTLASTVNQIHNSVFLSFLCSSLIQTLSADNPILRDVAASCISSLFQHPQLRSNLLNYLVHSLQGENGMNSCYGSLLSIRRISEDHPSLINPLITPNLILPLLSMLSCDTVMLKLLSLDTLNWMFAFSPLNQCIRSEACSIIDKVVNLLSDGEGSIRLASVKLILSIVETHPMYVESFVEGLLSALVVLIQHDAEEVVKVAADVVNCLCRFPDISEQFLIGHCTSIVPALFKHIPYSEMEASSALERCTEGIGVADDESKVAYELITGVSMDDQDEEGFYTTRSACCKALDILASVCGEEVIGPLLPAFNELMTSSDWRKKEGAVLALGAVIPGAAHGFKTQVQQLSVYLLGLINGKEEFPVKTMSLWTLGRLLPLIPACHPDNFTEILGSAYNSFISILNNSNSKELIRGAATALSTFVRVVTRNSALVEVGDLIRLIIDSSISCSRRSMASIKPQTTIFYLWNIISEELGSSCFDDLKRSELSIKLIDYLIELPTSSSVLTAAVFDCLCNVLLVSTQSTRVKENIIYDRLKTVITNAMNLYMSGKDLPVSVFNSLAIFIDCFSSLVRQASLKLINNCLGEILDMAVAILKSFPSKSVDVLTVKASVFALIGDVLGRIRDKIDEISLGNVLLPKFSFLLNISAETLTTVSSSLLTDEEEALDFYRCGVNSICVLVFFIDVYFVLTKSHHLSSFGEEIKNLVNPLTSSLVTSLNNYFISDTATRSDRHYSSILLARLIEFNPYYFIQQHPSIVTNWIGNVGSIEVTEELKRAHNAGLGLVRFVVHCCQGGACNVQDSEFKLILKTFTIKFVPSILSLVRNTGVNKNELIHLVNVLVDASQLSMVDKERLLGMI